MFCTNKVLTGLIMSIKGKNNNNTNYYYNRMILWGFVNGRGYVASYGKVK
jgi:hypothetical protein